jgi:hypothetical protein
MFGGVVLSSNFTTMKEQEPYKAFKDKEATESVKIKKSLLNKLRNNKLETGVNITAFVEQAIKEKLTKKTN